MTIRLRPCLAGGLALAAVCLGAGFTLRVTDVRKVSLEEVLAIGTLDDDALFQLTGVAVDAEGFIYVLDGMDYSLKKFDVRGRLVKKTGRKGQGPGEFKAPRLLECGPTRVFATDQAVPAISMFDRDLKFLRTIPCPRAVLSMRALGDDRVAVLTAAAEGPAKIMTLSLEGKALSELPFSGGNAGLLMDSASFAAAPDGSFIIAYLFLDKIERWGADGKRLWSRALLGQKKVARTNVESPLGKLTLPTDTSFHDVALAGGGLIFALGGRLAKNPGRDVYVLGGDGRLLTTFSLPEASHCLVIDRSGFLYARANDGITLKKYRIRYE